MKRALGLCLGMMTVLGLQAEGIQREAIAQTPSAALPDTLLVSRRQTLVYPGGSPTVTVRDERSAGTVTLSISPARRPDEVTLSLQANSFQAEQCALVSIQLPPNLLAGDQTYQLNTTPVILLPLTSRGGYCGNTNAYRQTYVGQAKTTHQTLLDLPFTPDSSTPIPFTVEVFFTRMIQGD